MKKTIESIKNRINWLKIELIHSGYLEGVVSEKYRKEIDKLLEELKELEDSNLNNEE